MFWNYTNGGAGEGKGAFCYKALQKDHYFRIQLNLFFQKNGKEPTQWHLLGWVSLVLPPVRGTPGRQPTYLPQVVVQSNVLRMLAKAVFPALGGGAPTYPATEKTEGVGENH